MGCATGLVKYLVFIANLIFVLAGLGLVAIGSIFKFKYLKNVSEDGIPTEFGIAPVLTIIVGAIIFITAFFGCCGAIRESTCMLTTYAIILLSIFIIQIAIGVFAFLQVKDSPDYRSELQRGLTKTFDQYFRSQEAKETVDLTQTFLECCGVHGPEYWDGKISNGSYPLSCCRGDQRSECRRGSLHVNNEGCTDALVKLLQNTAKILAYVVIGIGVAEIIGALFGLCLASSIRNHYRRNIYA